MTPTTILAGIALLLAILSLLPPVPSHPTLAVAVLLLAIVLLLPTFVH